MLDKDIIGKRIAAIRRGLGYSQNAFAEKLHVTAQAVSKWETGLALPDMEVLLNISWIAKVSLHAILEGEDFLEEGKGLDRGLLYASRFLVCPQCREKLSMQLSPKRQEPQFVCGGGHCFDFVDGVIHFGTREMEGELWSLWLRNYAHYLEEQQHPGNPRYWQGEPHEREVMWRKIEELRPRVILDIASGTGSGMKYIMERIYWPVTVIMTDLSHRILKWNRMYFSDAYKNPYVDMVYLACDCARLPLDDSSVDVVFSNGGFESMQTKMPDGFREAYRVLKPGGHAVYNRSVVDDHNGGNTQKWLRLYEAAVPGHPDLEDIDGWLAACEKTGFQVNQTTKIYGELPAPAGDVFPFENEVLQWTAAYVVVSQK